MRASMLLSLGSLLLVGCTQPGPPPGSAPNNAFARDLAGRVAGKAQSCVTSFPNENLRIIDAQTIAYGSGRTIYVNHLGAPCPALSPYNTVIADVQGGQYCRGDRVRGLEPGATIPGPWCVLGNWIPYRQP